MCLIIPAGISRGHVPHYTCWNKLRPCASSYPCRMTEHRSLFKIYICLVHDHPVHKWHKVPSVPVGTQIHLYCLWLPQYIGSIMFHLCMWACGDTSLFSGNLSFETAWVWMWGHSNEWCSTWLCTYPFKCTSSPSPPGYHANCINTLTTCIHYLRCWLGIIQRLAYQGKTF